MNFQPKTEREIADSKLLPAGRYRFTVLDAWDKMSQAGNEMIEMKIEVANGGGISRVLSDYLVAKRPEKLRHCCAACGLLEEYETGTVTATDFIDRSGQLLIAIERGRKGANGSKFPDRNVIEDYVSA